MIATKYYMGYGVGISGERLASFDKALINAGVGNYNLVKLSSILPAGCKRVIKFDKGIFPEHGSLLPVAYATISTNKVGQRITSGVAIGFPEDEEKVGVIMEYSDVDKTYDEVKSVLDYMINEAFEIRGWRLDKISHCVVSNVLRDEGKTLTTFACVAEW